MTFADGELIFASGKRITNFDYICLAPDSDDAAEGVNIDYYPYFKSLKLNPVERKELGEYMAEQWLRFATGGGE